MNRRSFLLDGGAIPSVILPQKEHWTSTAFLETARQLDVEPIVQKRIWEYIVIALLLKSLRSSADRILGVGVGNEPLIDFVTKHYRDTVLTDLWTGQWLKATGAPASGSLVQADARSLPFVSDSFDAVWSTSTVEHVGHDYSLWGRTGRRLLRILGGMGLRIPARHGGSMTALQEIARIVRPTGHAIVSTEIILNGRTDAEFFGMREFLNLAAAAGLLPVSNRYVTGVDDFFLAHTLPRSRMKGWNDPLPHVYLNWEGTVFTSAVFVLGKGRSSQD